MNSLQEILNNILVEFDSFCQKHDIEYQLSSGTLLGAVRHKGFIPWDDDIDVHMKRSEYDKFLRVFSMNPIKDIFLQTMETEKQYFHSYAKLRYSKIQLVEKSDAHLNIDHGIWIDILPYDCVPKDKKLATQQRKRIIFYNKLIVALVFVHPEGESNRFKKYVKLILHRLSVRTIKFNPLPRFIVMRREKWIHKYNACDCEDYNLLSYPQVDSDFESTYLSSQELTESISALFERKSYPITKHSHHVLSRLYGDYMKLPPIEKRISNHDTISFESMEKDINKS